jgi:hypothetical protein
MTETEAREVTLLQAFETAQPASPSWTDADRRWADRVAQEAVSDGTPAPSFIAVRARHAMQRLLAREPAAGRWLGRRRRDGVWLVLVAVVAAGLGLLGDAIGNEQRINLLAPPYWGVLLWNLVVYALLLAAPVLALLRRSSAAPGPLRRAMQALLGWGRHAPSGRRGPSAGPLAAFATLWAGRSARVASLRAQTLLHVGAAALALGLVAGLYLRGLVLDYRVGWESTFLSAATVRDLLTTLLSPAATLAGIALPDAAGFAALQTQPGGAGTGAPAAMWIHLLALTLLAVVVVPRLLLALGTAAWAGQHRRRFGIDLDAPYFQRLARLQRGSAAEIEVLPYAHAPSPQATLGLQALLAEAFGPRAVIRVAPTAAFGAADDAAPLPALAPSITHALILCELGATPEAESHGRFAARLAERLPGGAVLAFVVDEAPFRRRFAGLDERLEQRRAAWSRFAEAMEAVPAFVDLEAPVEPSTVEALQAALARPVQVRAEPATAARR